MKSRIKNEKNSMLEVLKPKKPFRALKIASWRQQISIVAPKIAILESQEPILEAKKPEIIFHVDF